MKKRVLILLLAAAAAATACLTSCDGGKEKKKPKKPENKDESVVEETDSEAEESTLGVLQDFDEKEPSVINGIILESQASYKNSEEIEELAEEGFSKNAPISSFELDEVFEVYIDTQVTDGWNIYICRHDLIDDISSLTEDKLKKLSDKDGFSNTLGNVPNTEEYGDIGGMCVNADESDVGQYDMFLVRNGKIDSFIELEMTPSSLNPEE